MRLSDGLKLTANAALALSQTLDQTGSWVLFDRARAVAVPSDRFQYLNQMIALFPDAPYRLELHVIAVSTDRHGLGSQNRADCQRCQ